MNIVSFHPGHDGAIASVQDGVLQFSYEAEKDSFPRYSEMTPHTVLEALSYLKRLPEVVAISGYNKFSNALSLPLEAGYYGIHKKSILTRECVLLGEKVKFFSSSHERSHIVCSYGMSHLPQGEPCYVLVWEGMIGNFYEVDEHLNISLIGEVLQNPGVKYAFIYALADPKIPSIRGRFKFSDAGKLMALTSFSKRDPYTKEERALADVILNTQDILSCLDKSDLTSSSLYNVGVESDVFKNFSGNYSDSLFDVFYHFAKDRLKKKLPLLISGGCGLNCDWNTRWKDSGLFQEVFVPPVTNDSGSAIGTAIDAQFYYTGNAKMTWGVYSGAAFQEDDISLEAVEVHDLDYAEVAYFLASEKIIGWVQGRAEIGPRALGNRSILAAPFKREMQDRLNKM